jgi:hypothetical protein
MTSLNRRTTPVPRKQPPLVPSNGFSGFRNERISPRKKDRVGMSEIIEGIRSNGSILPPALRTSRDNDVVEISDDDEDVDPVEECSPVSSRRFSHCSMDQLADQGIELDDAYQGC